MSAPKSARGAGKPRHYPVEVRTRCLRALLSPNRTLSLSRRVRIWADRLGMSDRTIWRWLARYRAGGANELRDRLRGDLLTRRAPRNVTSITPGAPVRLPLDAPTSRATRVPS
jgi:hypothetical protein